jgi:hypothetical protein
MSKKSSWWSDKHRKYKYKDKKSGLNYDLSLEQAKALMSLPCFYCCKPESRGLDRISNDKGHEISNVVPCCGTCNLMLASTPWAAKLEMRESLRSIRDKNLLGDWKPPYLTEPQKVNSNNNDADNKSSSTTIELELVQKMSEEVMQDIDKEIVDILFQQKQVQIEQFRSNPKSALEELKENDCVSIVEKDGSPRMYMLKQCEHAWYGTARCQTCGVDYYGPAASKPCVGYWAV